MPRQGRPAHRSDASAHKTPEERFVALRAEGIYAPHERDLVLGKRSGLIGQSTSTLPKLWIAASFFTMTPPRDIASAPFARLLVTIKRQELGREADRDRDGKKEHLQGVLAIEENIQQDDGEDKEQCHAEKERAEIPDVLFEFRRNVRLVQFFGDASDAGLGAGRRATANPFPETTLDSMKTIRAAARRPLFPREATLR